MRNLLTLILLLLAMGYSGYSQDLDVEGIIRAQNIEVDGPIKIGDHLEDPLPGTIRFNPINNDFEGFNGIDWYSITGVSFELSTVEDCDDNVYNTVVIGDQEWMTENFRGSCYNDGTPIEKVVSDEEWQTTTSGAWCWLNNDFNADLKYGKLYNFYAVETGKLCPTGWKVPSEEDFFSLRDYLGLPNTASHKLRQRGTLNWEEPNDSATNSSGFTAIPAGSRIDEYKLIKSAANFWTSSEELYAPPVEDRARALSIINREVYPQDMSNPVNTGSAYRYNGFPIRCLKDQ